MRLPSKVLIITEGKDTEVGFFQRFIKVFKQEDNIEIVPFSQNIKELYSLMQEYVFEGIYPNNTLEILRQQPTITAEDKQKLKGKFSDIFLVFDLDIQNSVQFASLEEYLDIVEKLIIFFNDSTRRGQILINYPMMESFRHIKTFKDPDYKNTNIPGSISFSKKYCNYLHKKGYVLDYNKFKLHNFNQIAALNLIKANYIVCKKYERPNKFVYEDNLSQINIFYKQKRLLMLKKSRMHVLNTSLFFYVDLYGKELFFNQRGDYLF